MVQEQREVMISPKQDTAFDIELMDPRVVSISGKLDELIRQIEELRSSMIKAKEGRSYTDPEVIAASQELDSVLDKYQEMMMKNKLDTDEEQNDSSIIPQFFLNITGGGGSASLKFTFVPPV